MPLLWLLADFFSGGLGPNPIQAIEQRSGLSAVSFLAASLACTPLAWLFGWKTLMQRRKALGNYGFLYAALHLLTFFVLDYDLDFAAIWGDVGQKAYILIGAAAFLLLLPLAVTSFNYWMKRLGKNWKRLHRLVYLISPLVIIHFFMAKKGDFLRLSGDISQPLAFAALIAILLSLRLPPVKRVILRLKSKNT
ncbi:MAG: sulfoxide reductase heme-binding subunit YedZ [Anaerolineales bacterium]